MDVCISVSHPVCSRAALLHLPAVSAVNLTALRLMAADALDIEYEPSGGGGRDDMWFSYRDADGDLVSVLSESELQTALRTGAAAGGQTVLCLRAHMPEPGVGAPYGLPGGDDGAEAAGGAGGAAEARLSKVVSNVLLDEAVQASIASVVERVRAEPWFMEMVRDCTRAIVSKRARDSLDASFVFVDSPSRSTAAASASSTAASNTSPSSSGTSTSPSTRATGTPGAAPTGAPRSSRPAHHADTAGRARPTAAAAHAPPHAPAQPDVD